MRIPVPGDVIADKYRLDELLGEGGFGVVMRATTELTGRPVAVKVLKPKSGGYETSRSARFLREMRTIAQLQCPHTLTLYDFGRTDDGVLYMVCEFVEGEDLLELVLRRERLEEHEATWILYQVLQSLSEAHGLGVLHRDIKPANIRIFTHDNDPLRVKVLDFGLAKAIEPGKHADLTATNKVIGTPRYMSPEQLTGKPLSEATDLYAVGLVAAEMLLGRAHEIFEKFRPGTEVRLSPTHGISTDLCRFVNRLLERDVATRYRTAEDALKDLRPLRRRGRVPQSAPAPTSGLEAADTRATTVARNSAPPRRPADDPDRGLTLSVIAVLALLTLFILLALTVVAALKEPTPSPPQVPPASGAALVKRADDGSKPPRPVITPVPDTIRYASGCGSKALKLGLDDVPGVGTIYVPTTYDPNHRHPVVLDLRPVVRASNTTLDSLAEEHRFIVLRPIVSSVAFPPWAAGREPDSVERIIKGVSPETAAKLFGLADLELCIDRGRVFALAGDGRSRTTRHLACEIPLAGIAIRDSAETPPEEPCTLRPVPRLIVLGREDGRVPRSGGKTCLQRTSPSWRELDRAWWKAHECTEESARQLVSDAEGECQEWACSRAAYARCEVNGGAEVDRVYPLCGPAAGDFPWVEHAWAFFQRLPPRDDQP